MTQSSQPSLVSIFNQKYTEFANELKGCIPEHELQINAALVFSPEDRIRLFREKVLPSCAPTRNTKTCPGCVLPGVVLKPALWEQLSDASMKAIQQYLTIMSFCCLYDGANPFGANPLGANPLGANPQGANPQTSTGQKDISGNDLPGEGFNPMDAFKMFESFMGGSGGNSSGGSGGDSDGTNWAEKLGGIDMNGFTKKFTEFMNSSNFSKLPEKFMKGQLAKLCEELVREFKPEDFGLSEEELKKYESEPHKVFELITEIYTKKPELLQKAIQRISKRFQEKFEKGQLRPEQIVAEAEELMKEFSENKSFVELLEGFRSMFDMKDMTTARKAGQEGSARLSLVKERLKKKLESKNQKQASPKK